MAASGTGCVREGGCGTIRSHSALKASHSAAEKKLCASGSIASRSSITRRVCSFQDKVWRLLSTS
jgi:hypothetical protein